MGPKVACLALIWEPVSVSSEHPLPAAEWAALPLCIWRLEWWPGSCKGFAWPHTDPSHISAWEVAQVPSGSQLSASSYLIQKLKAGPPGA